MKTFTEKPKYFTLINKASIDIKEKDFNGHKKR